MNKRLVKNWEPLVPPYFHQKDLPFSVGDTLWTPERKEWLRAYYSDAENWQLANRMNTFVGDIERMAKAMHLKKCREFLRWEKYGVVRQDGAPFGWHWETEEEQAIRLERERQEDEERAKRIAMGFSFCTSMEKSALASVLLEALQWARVTEPDVKDMEDWP